MLGGFKLEAFPSTPSLVSEVWIPALDTSLLTFKLNVFRSECQGKPSSVLLASSRPLTSFVHRRAERSSLRASRPPVLAPPPRVQILPQRAPSLALHPLVGSLSPVTRFALRLLRLAPPVLPRPNLLEGRYRRACRSGGGDQGGLVGDARRAGHEVQDGRRVVPLRHRYAGPRKAAQGVQRRR